MQRFDECRLFVPRLTSSSLINLFRLVERSRDLQNEIVDAGRGTAPPNEFYRRNHQWTKGLLSAAQAVGVAALELM